jgi:hypothetical protein
VEIDFLEKEILHQNDETRYWFRVDGEDYCISDCAGTLTMLDSKGCRVDEPSFRQIGIRNLLMTEYKSIVQ